MLAYIFYIFCIVLRSGPTWDLVLEDMGGVRFRSFFAVTGKTFECKPTFVVAFFMMRFAQRRATFHQEREGREAHVSTLF